MGQTDWCVKFCELRQNHQKPFLNWDLSWETPSPATIAKRYERATMYLKSSVVKPSAKQTNCQLHSTNAKLMSMLYCQYSRVVTLYLKIRH